MKRNEKKEGFEKAKNYQKVAFTKREKLITLLQGLGILTVVSYFFYRSFWAFLLFSPYLFFHFRKKGEEIRKKQLEELRYQFKDGILAISAALNAGYSVENAFRESQKDLALLYEENAPIRKEFQRILHGIAANERLEKLLFDFAKRSGLEEIESFAEVFATAREASGDFSLIIRTTAEKISDKMEVVREIKTMAAAKVFEQRIMSLIPFFIMLYIDLTSPGFFNPLYGNWLGVVIMSVCLGVYLLSQYVSKRIMQIPV